MSHIMWYSPYHMGLMIFFRRSYRWSNKRVRSNIHELPWWRYVNDLYVIENLLNWSYRGLEISFSPKYKIHHMGGMLRWLKKSSKETCLTWSHMNEKSRWLNFKMAQNLDHVFFTEMAHFFSHLTIPPYQEVLGMSNFLSPISAPIKVGSALTLFSVRFWKF